MLLLAHYPPALGFAAAVIRNLPFAKAIAAYESGASRAWVENWAYRTCERLFRWLICRY